VEIIGSGIKNPRRRQGSIHFLQGDHIRRQPLGIGSVLDALAMDLSTNAGPQLKCTEQAVLHSESRAAGKPANAGQVVSRCFSRGQLLPTEVGRFHACRQQCQSHAVPYCLLARKDRRSLKSRNDLRIVELSTQDSRFPG
jgi:hypothetical protein